MHHYLVSWKQKSWVRIWILMTSPRVLSRKGLDLGTAYFNEVTNFSQRVCVRRDQLTCSLRWSHLWRSVAQSHWRRRLLRASSEMKRPRCHLRPCENNWNANWVAVDCVRETNLGGARVWPFGNLHKYFLMRIFLLLSPLWLYFYLQIISSTTPT